MRIYKIITTEPSVGAVVSTVAESSGPFVGFAHGAGFDNDICGFVEGAEVGIGLAPCVGATPHTLDEALDETLGTSATDKSFPLFSFRSDGVLVGIGAVTVPIPFVTTPFVFVICAK